MTNYFFMKISKVFILQIQNSSLIRKIPIIENFKNLKLPYPKRIYLIFKYSQNIYHNDI